MESLNEAVANQRLAVLCTYPLAGCGALEILDVVRTHQFALARRHGSWDVIETAGLKQAKGCDPETNRPSYSLFMERLHPEDRDRVEEILKRAVREKSDFEFDYRIVLPDGSIKFLRSVGEALVNPVGELEFIGTTMDVTGLKRAEEMELAIAREREVLMRQRAADLAKANEALRSCIDALASVPELDAFIGQVMAAITRQLGAFSSNLRVLNADQKGMRIELLFQDGSVISSADADYPERFQSLSLEELGFTSLEAPYTVLNLSGLRALEMSADLRGRGCCIPT